MMKRTYYIFGSRPIYKEESKSNIPRYYAFQWHTGEFKEDISYFRKIVNDLSGEAEEISKEEFDIYVEKLKNNENL